MTESQSNNTRAAHSRENEQPSPECSEMKPTTRIRQSRRVERTQKALFDSLLELIVEKGYDTTTVEDVLRRADVGRTAFYSHFDNKQDLLQHGFSASPCFPWCSSGEALGGREQVPDVTALFEHVAQQPAALRALRGTATLEQGLISLRESLIKCFEPLSRGRHGGNQDIGSESHLVAQALTGALMQLLAWWLESGMPETPATMNRWFNQMAQRILGI